MLEAIKFKMINQVDDFQFESVIASSMDNNEALIALEQLLFNLQENMMALQDEVMFNHTNQEDLITSLQDDFQASQDIEWSNHTMQEGQIMDLQDQAVSNHMMQEGQIMDLQNDMLNNQVDIDMLQNDMMYISDMSSMIEYQGEQIMQNGIENEMLQNNINMLQDEMLSMSDYQEEQIMMLEHEVDSLQTQLASVLSLCENLQSQINNLSTSISLGNYHEGGVVFFVNSTGEHGLVADMSHTLEELTSIEVFYSFCHESSDGNSILLYDMVLNEEDLDQFCDGWFVPNSWTLSDIYHAIGPGGISYPSLNNLDFIWSSDYYTCTNFFVYNFNEGSNFIMLPDSSTAGVILVRPF